MKMLIMLVQAGVGSNYGKKKGRKTKKKREIGKEKKGKKTGGMPVVLCILLVHHINKQLSTEDS